MKQCHLLVHAGILVTQDARRRVLEDGSLAIVRDAEGEGVIADVGPHDALAARWEADRIMDLRHALILPGLVNAHSHAAMTLLRGLADDMPLMEWLTTRIFPVEQRLVGRMVHLGSLLGYAEMLRSGITACMDMYFFANDVLAAAHEAGVRCTGGEAVFAFASAACSGPGEALARTRDLAARCREYPRLHAAVNAHSVYTTTPEILGRCRDLALELRLPLHMHLAETPAETELCLREHGQRPVAYCHGLGLFEAPCTLAHVVDVTGEEMALLASRRAVAVHNPSSNMKLASGIAPVPDMLDAGLGVALGTDGAASNNRLNLFSEMREAALIHKLNAHDPAVLPAAHVLDMATLGGAAALRNGRIGSLEPGMYADCVALDLSAANLQPLYNATSQLVYAATGHETCMTMVGGEVLYENGRFTRFDYPALCRELRELRPYIRRASGLAAS